MLNVALIGAGTMGSYHARVVSSSGRARLARVVDAYEPSGTSVAERYGARWTDSLGDLDGVDAVIVAASTEAHYGLAKEVIAAGVPLLVEKPVVNDYERSREIVELSAAARVPLLCGLLERFNPAVLTARHMIDAPVHITSTRHSPYAPRIKTGVAWDLLIHDVDLAIGFFGSAPVSSSGGFGYFHPSSVSQAEDVASATLLFGDGQMAQASASRIGQKKDRTMTVHELDRLIEIDLLRRDVTIYRHVSATTTTDDGRGYRQQTSIEIPEITNAREPLAAQFDHFVDLIQGEADVDAERESILGSHRVIAGLLAQE
ncbi:Gfo/Idh/MocA family oxidoreductase [Microbacterium sp. QXD-8]|uniref:Gfo/Idh/MocA family oxidoreductase n=1 Tax=Microbacterium psychrotolerans TaxID=3068321 RepID=A0ABU0Z2E8_9MICO|nr:Gfo/Idh/MocA family oxidoreductase [Microbacterium sp. QXD-8]MDQ7878754.1 Gfo/Idh/MocA family oxidoreductase [Microbacterium sp. QXD-8]